MSAARCERATRLADFGPGGGCAPRYRPHRWSSRIAAMTRFRPDARNCCASGPRSAILPLLESANHLSKRVALLAFVQAGVAELPEPRRFQPVQHEKGPLYS